MPLCSAGVGKWQRIPAVRTANGLKNVGGIRAEDLKSFTGCMSRLEGRKETSNLPLRLEAWGVHAGSEQGVVYAHLLQYTFQFLQSFDRILV